MKRKGKRVLYLEFEEATLNEKRWGGRKRLSDRGRRWSVGGSPRKRRGRCISSQGLPRGEVNRKKKNGGKRRPVFVLEGRYWGCKAIGGEICPYTKRKKGGGLGVLLKKEEPRSQGGVKIEGILARKRKGARLP